MDKNKNSKTVPFFPLEIYEDKKEKWLEYYVEIDNLAKQNKSIPAELVKGFFSCFKLKMVADSIRKEEKVSDYSSKILEKFKGSDYNFSVITLENPTVWFTREGEENGPPPKEEIEYSFKKMIEETLVKILDDEGKIKMEKDECLRKIYQAILSYCEKIWNTKKDFSFSDYKMKVITAFIAMTLGYKLTEKTKPTNEYLFQSTRSALGDFKKKLLE